MTLQFHLLTERGRDIVTVYAPSPCTFKRVYTEALQASLSWRRGGRGEAEDTQRQAAAGPGQQGSSSAAAAQAKKADQRAAANRDTQPSGRSWGCQL